MQFVRQVDIRKKRLMFYIIKETFLDHKIGTFQKANTRNFQKGLTRDLCQKF